MCLGLPAHTADTNRAASCEARGGRRVRQETRAHQTGASEAHHWQHAALGSRQCVPRARRVALDLQPTQTRTGAARPRRVATGASSGSRCRGAVPGSEYSTVGSPLHICAGTELTPSTSAPGLGPMRGSPTPIAPQRGCGAGWQAMRCLGGMRAARAHRWRTRTASWRCCTAACTRNRGMRACACACACARVRVCMRACVRVCEHVLLCTGLN